MSLTLKRYIYIYIYIPPFKKNNEEELKANIARIDKGKKIYVDSEISKNLCLNPPRKYEFVLTCHHYHVVGHIRPNCAKLMSL